MEFIAGGFTAVIMVGGLFIGAALWMMFADWVDFEFNIDSMIVNFLGFIFLIGGFLGNYNVPEKPQKEVVQEQGIKIKPEPKVTKENGYTTLGE